MKKYLVIGGHVRSRSVGDMHYVTAYSLTKLYHVPPEECIMAEEDTVGEALNGVEPYLRSRLIRLFPRLDGNYTLRTATGQAVSVV